MSSEWELDEGIKSIKSAWRREHTARANLEIMLKQAEAENVKLRKEVVDLQKSLQTYESENAKLRELIADYERCSVHADCDTCEHDGKMSVHCPLSPCFPDTDELYELGIEVGDGQQRDV